MLDEHLYYSTTLCIVIKVHTHRWNLRAEARLQRPLVLRAGLVVGRTDALGGFELFQMPRGVLRSHSLAQVVFYAVYPIDRDVDGDGPEDPLLEPQRPAEPVRLARQIHLDELASIRVEDVAEDVRPLPAQCSQERLALAPTPLLPYRPPYSS